MDDMGYQNVERVEALLCRTGKLSEVTKSGNMTFNFPAYAIMVHLAEQSRSKEGTSKGGLPYWCYWRGQTGIIAALGLALPTPEQVSAALDGTVDLDEINAKRIRTIRNQLTRIMTFLQEHGCIKKLRDANKFANKNAVWLLLLGDDEENAEAERQARAYFGIPFMDKDDDNE